MTSFQWVAFAILGMSFLLTVTLTVRRSVTPRVGLAWSLLWIAAAVSIARPEMIGAIARGLGIGRGADLVLYLAILAMVLGFFAVYVRMRRMERELTKIVRELALRSPQEPEQR